MPCILIIHIYHQRGIHYMTHLTKEKEKKILQLWNAAKLDC